jgi:hypothetical protein
MERWVWVREQRMQRRVLEREGWKCEILSFDVKGNEWSVVRVWEIE